MYKMFLRICSLLLTLTLLINLLPMGVLGAEVRALAEEDISDMVDDSGTAQIVGEVTEKRGEYSKEYILSNGLHMAAVYDNPVHYQENGEWKEIDNTLRSSGTGEDAVYTNTAGGWDIALPQQMSTGRAVTVSKDGYTLSFTMTGEVHSSDNAELATASEEISTEESPFSLQQAEEADAQIHDIDWSDAVEEAEYPEMIPEKLRSRLEYSDVYENTDIIYDLNSNELKESIVMGQYSDTLWGYQYALNVGGMTPVLTDSGEILLYDAAGEEIVMVMPAPYLLDDAGEYCADVTVDLQDVNGSYILTYILPQDWLADESRQWPVVLDPIISKEADFQNSEDQTLYENVTMSASESSVTCGYDASCGNMRFYWKYNVLPELTSADVIVSANLRLYANERSGTALIEVHQVLEDWDADEITWTDQPTFDNLAADFANCKTAGSTTSFYTWEVTDVVRSWYSGANYGMVFKMSDTAEAAKKNGWIRFFSSEMDLACMPVMTIIFRNNNGLESYWDYTASSAGRAGTGYINNYTGNLIWVHGDIGFGGNRMPVSISHIYNANDSGNNLFGMGYGWRTNFNQRVYKWEHEDAYGDYYVWEDSDGTSHYFYKDSTTTGKYLDEDGLELTLTTTGTGDSTYCLADKYGNKSYFDAKGRLTKQSNNQQTASHITVTYTTTTSNLISTITDGAGRKYYFEYDTSNQLSKISYKGSGSTVISYVSFKVTNGKLMSITNADGKSASYTYAANSADTTKNLIATATDIDGYKIAYTYTTDKEGMPARVASVKEYDGTVAGGTLTIEYGQNQTTFTDHNGNVQIMQFNTFGNTIAIMDDQGRAQYAQYAFNTSADAADNSDTTAKGNQLRVSSKLQNTVGNVLDDSSFERGTAWTATSSAVTVSVASGTAYHGSKALKIVRSTAGTAAGAYSASFSVAAGTTYTFSAYVKTGTGAAYLALNDGSTTVTSETLAANSSWTRLEVSYTNTASSSKTVTARLMTAAAGTVHMDCVQVEKCVTASRYNLVENGDFRYSTAWSASSGRTTATAPAPELSANVYKLTGTATATNRLSQTVTVSGSAGDTFVLAGWAMGNSVPLDAYDTNPREFSLIATFTYTDGTTGSTTVRFNPYVTNWQYAAGFVTAEKAYSSVKVELAYDYNLNSAIFDGIQLFKEEFGSHYTYDANGNVKTATDVQGGTTTYTYDSNQNLSSVTLPDNTKLTYTYDSYHNVKTATTQTGVAYEFTYDKWGNNTSVSIVSGTNKITSYAAYNAVPANVDAATLPEQNQYGNRLESTTDTVGNVTRYSYNADTNVLEWVRYPEDTEDTQTEYDYDTMYRLAKAEVTTDTGSTLSATYTYTNDLLTKITTKSTEYTFAYGNFSLRTSIKAGNYTLASYEYTNDRNNYLKKLAYGNGDSVQYTYDDLGRVTVQTYEDGDTVSYKYDNNGALATVTDSATGITTTYYYDFADRLMKYVESDGTNTHSVGYEYDEINNLSKRVETINGVEHTTSYTYDSDNRLTAVVNDKTRINYTYDSYGRVTRESSYGSILVVMRGYTYTAPTSTTSSGQIASVAISSNGLNVLYHYTYDDNGNITAVRTASAPVATYVYDSAGQLLRENNYAAGKTWVWEYDNAGNILSRTEYAYTTSAILGDVLDTVDYVYDDDKGWGDLLTSYDEKSITYDTIGNPVKITDSTGNVLQEYEWEHGRELVSMTNGTTTWEYTYDVDGMRTSRSDGTTTYEYIYNGGSLVQMTVGGNTLYFSNSSVVYNGVTFYYVTNLQGDIIAILNSTGVVVVEYTYDAWGNILSISGGMASTLGTLNPLRYRGYVYDSETGLYYLQSRYYDPEMGRFINADNYVSTGGILGSNMFAYCSNNPVNYLDPAGADAVYFTDYVIYALSGALAELITGISSIKASIEAALASVAVPVVCIAAVAVAITAIVYLVEAMQELSLMAEQVIAWVKAQVEAKELSEEQLHGYTVYVIVLNGTTDVVYVGMTKNFSSRQYAHQRKPKARFPIACYSMVPVATGLSYKDARALEQTLISAFTLDSLKNAINSISQKNLDKFIYEFERMGSLIAGNFIPE